MKVSKDEWVDIVNMPIRMSKKVYNEMVKEMDIIASHEEPYQQQCASNLICNHWICRLGIINKGENAKMGNTFVTI